MSNNTFIISSNLQSQYDQLRKNPFENCTPGMKELMEQEKRYKKDLVENVVIVQLSENAKMPERADPGAAGYDLFSTENIVLERFERAAIGTGVKMIISSGSYGRIAPRSGLALNYGIDILAGVVDSSYRGEIKVILINLGKDKFEITEGMKIAQIVFEKIITPRLLPGSVSMCPSQRAESGFGSTGLMSTSIGPKSSANISTN